MTLSDNIPATRWRRYDTSSYALRDVGDGFVVYHRPSGKTHLLNEASHRLLTQLLIEPKDLAAIAAAFDPGGDGPTREEYLASVAEMLRRLERYGLIERV